MDCDFSPSSPHLLPNGLFSPQNRISFELLALSGLLGFSTFKGGKMLIFQGFANSRIVREFPPFSFKVRIATLTRNQVYRQRYRGFESHPLRQISCLICLPDKSGNFLAFRAKIAQNTVKSTKTGSVVVDLTAAEPVFLIFRAKIPRTFWGKCTKQSSRKKAAVGGFEPQD